MRLHSIRLQNFRQHADTRIDFEDGLTGIIGANGTGKSTILEAIAWALYGNPAARGKRDSIRWMRAPARASVRVELDFELGSQRYLVVRGLNTAELYLDRATVPIANSNSAVTTVLQRRLGMTLDEFFNTYFTGQKELNVMAAMGPTERGQFLSRLLGYERLRVAQELARERRRIIGGEINGVKGTMPDPDLVRQTAARADEQLLHARTATTDAEARLGIASKSVAAVKPRWTAVQQERERVQSIDADVRVAESERTARQRELERHDRDLAELGTAQAELARLREATAPLAVIRAELETLDRLAREEGKRQTLEQDVRGLAAEIATLRERRTQYESAPTLLTDATAEMELRKAELDRATAALDAARTEWVRDRQEAETKVEQRRLDLDDYTKQRELLIKEGENGTCPICARPLGDHYRSVLDTIDEKIASVTEEGRYYRSRVEQLVTPPVEVAAQEKKRKLITDAIAKLEKKLTRIVDGVQTLASVESQLKDRETRHATRIAELAALPSGYSAQRHATLRTQCDELQVLESRASKLAGAIEREADLRLERERVAASLGVIANRLSDLAAERATFPDLDRRFEQVRAEFDAAAAAQRAAEVESATALARLSSARAAADVAAAAIVDLERAVARLAELNEERRLHEELDKAYTDLRTDLNVQLRPEISERASVLLAELTDGRYSQFELDESYDIVLIEDDLPKPVISGGEEDLANLVLRLAISQMIAERAGQPLSLLILDEVFGSLDESRRHNVIGLLARLHDRFEQVIIITHVDLPLADGMDRVIGISYDEETGASRIDGDSRAAIEQDELEMGAAD